MTISAQPLATLPSLVTASHAFPRHRADEALALTDTFADTMPHLALDVGEHPTEENLYQLTWFVASQHQATFTEALTDTLNLPEEPSWQPVDATIDYVAATRAAFPPLQIGQFFIARNDETPPPGSLGLSIMPNRAFGSGEHATTHACLESYLALTETGHIFKNGLDVGTGSAILALAAHRLQQTPFIGTDLDAPSVAIATENASLNNIPASAFTAVQDEDLTHPQVRARAPYDLIFANILMLPLIELAPAISALLAPGSALILSGFTDDQQSSVHAAYLTNDLNSGLTHQHTQTITALNGSQQFNWCASTFIKQS